MGLQKRCNSNAVAMESTHWPLDKMVDVLQTAFSSAFKRMQMLEIQIKFLWNVFFRALDR